MPVGHVIMHINIMDRTSNIAALAKAPFFMKIFNDDIKEPISLSLSHWYLPLGS